MRGKCLGGGIAFRLIAGRHVDAGTSPDIPLRDRQADAAAPAGDEHGLAANAKEVVYVAHHQSPGSRMHLRKEYILCMVSDERCSDKVLVNEPHALAALRPRSSRRLG